MNLSNAHLELIKEIGEYEGMVLTGSAALILQGFNIRRQPEDLDFLTSDVFYIEIVKQVLCSEHGYVISSESSEYDNHDVIKKHGVNVDFLYEKDLNYYTAIVRNTLVGISLPINNLCAKLRYTINDTTEESVIKNAKDLLYFITENESMEINLKLESHYDSQKKEGSPKNLRDHLIKTSGVLRGVI